MRTQCCTVRLLPPPGPMLAPTAFDSVDAVAIAAALATRDGRLALPNLEKISSKTLTALVTKKDVEIPFIETLELISEPDGTATEDFVIPGWLADRQDRQRLGLVK